MKYSLLVVALLTLTPCLVYAQNQQFSDCRTLEMAGNFMGADEALVDGLVCRVGKPKTSAPASRPAEAKAAEGVFCPVKRTGWREPTILCGGLQEGIVSMCARLMACA
jgi:hypothetical protein